MNAQEASRLTAFIAGVHFVRQACDNNNSTTIRLLYLFGSYAMFYFIITNDRPNINDPRFFANQRQREDQRLQLRNDKSISPSPF